MRKYVRTARGVEKTILQRSRATLEDGNAKYFSLTIKYNNPTFACDPDAAILEILGWKQYNA